MKKLTVLLMMPALFMCIVPVIASADGHGWKHFHGTYQMSASGSCLHSEQMYVQNALGWWTVPAGSKAYAGTTVSEGTWIFQEGGGKFSHTIYATIMPGGEPTIPVAVRVIEQKDVPFTYTITSVGEITVITGGIELSGSISTDKKSITLLSANNVQNFQAPFWYTICNTARVLIKVK